MKINCNYSVALCTYNGEKYITDQLNSILGQTIPPREIIVSDDGSKDHTLEIVKKVLKNSSIVYKIVENREVHGVTSNFNNAISLCTESIIFTSDQDDIWIKNKAEIILKIFQKNEKALLVFTNGELVNQNLQSLNCDIWTSIGITEKIFETNRCFEYMLKCCFVTGATMAFKRELFLVNEKIPSSWLHDGWLTWKAIARDALVPCNEKLILYRQHGENVVGMSSMASIKRIKNYFNNFKIIRDIHIIRYKRYVELKENMEYMFSDKEKEELNKCISFWKDLINSDESKKKLTRINIIIKHIINGNFEKYFNGKKGAFREILLIFLNK